MPNRKENRPALTDDWYKPWYKQMVRPAAPVVGLVCDGEYFAAVKIKCPYCSGIHTHGWRGGDSLGSYVPYCGTPGMYQAVLAGLEGVW